MSNARHYIAVDLGAESGRIMLGTLTGQQLTLAEIHRFANGPMALEGSLRWDFDTLLREIKAGIGQAVKAAPGEIAGIGVDSWGVDFGLLDDKDRLIEPPYHYRDARNDGMLDAAFQRMPKYTIYEHTGIQFMQINSVFQLLAMKLGDSAALARTSRITFMADLVSHALCGNLYAEYTLASTSQMLDMRTGKWATAVLEALGLPTRILPDIVQPCTVVGALRDDLARDLGCGPIPVIAVASHDTGDAVAAVPAETENWAYISSGTWSLMGAEIPRPVITERACDLEFTNEGGVDGTIRLLKNIVGLWLLQECRRTWQSEGDALSYDELTRMAGRARPFAAPIDPARPEFLAPGDMPRKISASLQDAGASPVTDRGETVRSILESLAFTYRRTLDMLEDLLSRRIEVVHIVGGGSQNELLNQFAANATGRRVIAGPAEATAIGNILLQARATGEVASLDALRAVVRASFPLREYTPRDPDTWQKEYLRRAGPGTD